MSGDADRLRDELADIVAEQAALEAELAVFSAEYERRVVRVLAELRALGAPAGRPQAAPVEPEAPPPVPPAELKRAFREAAKRMHPDLAAGAEAREHAEAFMKRLNEAYRAGDGQALADLVRQWDASPYGGAPAPVRRVAGLEAAVERARRRLAELRATELADLMERTMAAAAEGRDLLGELRADAEAALVAARANAWSGNPG